MSKLGVCVWIIGMKVLIGNEFAYKVCHWNVRGLFILGLNLFVYVVVYKADGGMICMLN